MMSCQECAKLDKKLRVLQSDFDFQFRKLSEDKSTEKALFQINVQKQIRKWQQKYTREKMDHEQNSKKWLQKIDSVTLDLEKRVKQSQARCEAALYSSKEKYEKQFAQFKQSMEADHSAANKKRIEKHQQETITKDNHYNQFIQSLKHEHSLEVQNVKKANAEKQTRVRIELQSYILGLRSEKSVDERNNLKLQEEFRIEKTKLVSQIYELKYKISISEEKIKQLNKDIIEKKDIILLKGQQLLEVSQCHKESISQLQNEYERQLLEQGARMQQKVKKFYENQLRITQKYEQSIHKIQHNRQVELELYRHNINEIKNCVESRPSRIEDLEQILILKDRLAKKQKECETLDRQLKDFQLELQNKEDTYNKIFIPTINSSHLPGENVVKRKELKMKRPAGRSVTTVREILNSVNINSNNLPLLNNLDKKLLPPRTTKIL